jgi:uncharacterized protein
MVARSTPGVYFEWHERRPPPARTRTDVAGFVGIAERGPLHTPVMVENWTDFRQRFGEHIPAGYLAYAVEGFFLNGGRRCYVVRVADPDAARHAVLDLVAPDGTVVRLTASSEGAWGKRLLATAMPLAPGRFNLTLRLDDQAPEIWRDLTLGPNSDDNRDIVPMLNGEKQDQAPSALARAAMHRREPCEKAPELETGVMGSANFDGGEDGLWTLRPVHLSGRGAPAGRIWGLGALTGVPEVAIVAMPDLMPPPDSVIIHHDVPRPLCDYPDTLPGPHAQAALDRPRNAPEYAPSFDDAEVLELQRALVAHCHLAHDRVAVLDARRHDRTPQDVAAWRANFDSSYAALYFPWLRVPDPLRVEGLLRTIPPSGYVAGVYARVEARSGAHQPPANERLENVRDLTVVLEDVLHGYLNDNRVNTIRVYPGRGLRVMGARTLSSEPQLRYVNVRRLLLALQRTLRINTQWLVFEPNNPQLQADVARVLRGLLDNLWLRGMLDGATPDEAYTVVCDETINMEHETEAGRLLALISIRAPYPAEFVVVRVGRTDQGIDFLERSEV